MRKPLCVDLYSGLGGWTEGFLAEGYDCIGFDIERHVYGEHRYPAQLVLQDVLTLHGKQFKDAQIIVASSPCQAYSYMAMPWTRAKQIARALRGQDVFPEGYEGPRTIEELNALFNAPRRIQREASEAAGRWIPMVQENVKGAQPWVGRASWHFGSYYLWGDVPALMPTPAKAQKFNPDSSGHPPGSWFAIADSQHRGARGQKNSGGSWFNVAHNTTSGHGQNPDGRLGNNPARGEATGEGIKNGSRIFPNDVATANALADGVKQGGEWFRDSSPNALRSHNSKSSARRAASARIAKIPFPLAQHIAHVYRSSPTVPTGEPQR